MVPMNLDCTQEVEEDRGYIFQEIRLSHHHCHIEDKHIPLPHHKPPSVQNNRDHYNFGPLCLSPYNNLSGSCVFGSGFRHHMYLYSLPSCSMYPSRILEHTLLPCMVASLRVVRLRNHRSPRDSGRPYKCSHAAFVFVLCHMSQSNRSINSSHPRCIVIRCMVEIQYCLQDTPNIREVRRYRSENECVHRYTVRNTLPIHSIVSSIL